MNGETYQFENFQKPCWCAEDVGVESETHGCISSLEKNVNEIDFNVCKNVCQKLTYRMLKEGNFDCMKLPCTGLRVVNK